MEYLPSVRNVEESLHLLSRDPVHVQSADRVLSGKIVLERLGLLHYSSRNAVQRALDLRIRHVSELPGGRHSSMSGITCISTKSDQ